MSSLDDVDSMWQGLTKNPVARALLSPLGLAYGALSSMRQQAYRVGLLKRMRPGIQVISIGNLTVGGTGKTPVVIDLARRCIARGKQVGILTRGYGRQDRQDSLVVAGGRAKTEYKATVQSLGDEPALILQAVPEAMVFVCSDRRKSALLAQEQYGLDTLILDDGFQHLPLERDYDLVLYDISDEPARAAVVPCGRLREPFGALRRASAVVFTKVDGADDPRIEAYRHRLQKYNPDLSFGSVSFAPSRCVSASGEILDLSALKDRRILAFSGIARHASFVETLRGLGAEIVESRDFGDHHWFVESELADLQARAKTLSVDLLVCTMKDMVKIGRFGQAQVVRDVIALDQDCEWHTLPEGLLAQYDK